MFAADPAAYSAIRHFVEAVAPVPPAEWSHFEGMLRSVHLERGQVLTRAGEVADRFAFVARGVVRKVHVTPQGRSVTRGFGGPGELVGAYVSLITQTLSHLTVEALVDTQVISVAWQSFVQLYDRHPCWDRVGRRIAEQALVERETRALELLTLSAAERYSRFCAQHAAILPSLHQYDIASYLGITPVSLSRLRSQRSR